MLLSRKWLDEFVHVDANDKDFAEAMTLSGSKVETTEDRGAEISNIVVGTILTMERHPDSDHMWICQLDVGQSAPIQIVTGAWNIHPGDMVPVALDHSTLPGGKKIEKGKLRGVESNGMMCGLYELGLDERDFPYAAIVPAAILNDYHPLDKDKPSIPADIQPGDKVFGPVVCAKILECASQPDYTFHTCLDLGGSTAVPDTICPNLHEGDLVAYNTKTGAICTLEDLHADQKEFPHCIPDGIFVLHEEGIQNGDDIKLIIGADDHVVEFEITPNRPDCLSVIGLAREVAATYQQPLTLHEPEVQGGADGVLTDLLDIETPAADLVPRYTARMVRNVKIAPSPKWMRERLRSMGVRPINNIVDITNYVMLEYGQPMHAFDYRYVKGGHIIVRRAEEGEELTTLGGYGAAEILERRVSSVCQAFGYDEIITYSFISPAQYDKIRWPEDYQRRNSFKILNPLGEDTSIMRTTTLPSMLEILTRNSNYRNQDVKLYEVGRTYLPGGEDGLAIESKTLTLGAYGGDMDFYAMKGAIEAILQELRVKDVTFRIGSGLPEELSYHPGRFAEVWSGSDCLGWFGQIHPLVAKNYGVDAEFYCAELAMDELENAKGADPEYVPLPKFPAVTRDIAVVCDRAVTVGALEDCIRRGAKGLLKDVSLFDIYTGSGIPEGKKSVAFNLTLRSDDRSLTAQEADEDVKSILETLKAELNAVLR